VNVIALDPVIDEANGESSTLRYYSPVLPVAVDGLFATLAGWRLVAVRLSRLADNMARMKADAVIRRVPEELRTIIQRDEPGAWISDPIGMRPDEPCAGAVSFMIGTSLAGVCAAIILFAALPRVETFAGFSIVIALNLVPVGALTAQPWQAMIFTAMVFNFVPLLAPESQMSYNTSQFCNSALAIIAGCGVATLSFRLLPPLSPALRTERFLVLRLRDLRRLATDAVLLPQDRWEGRVYGRLAALLDEAEPLQRGQLLTALSVGIDIINLRRILPRLDLGLELDGALAALAQRHSAAATARLTVDHRLAFFAETDRQSSPVLRARGRILAICDALVEYGYYFDTGASR
jgi:uncharacterized membrane protein YccC